MKAAISDGVRSTEVPSHLGMGRALSIVEEHQVENVFVAGHALLGQIVSPAQELEKGTDQALFDLGFGN